MKLYVSPDDPVEGFSSWYDFNDSSIFIYPEQVNKLDLKSIERASIYYGGETSPIWNKALPQMQSLETLLVRGTAGQKALNMIGKLPNLKQLRMNTTRKHDPDQMENVSQLTHLYLDKSVGITSLKKADNLRDLCVYLSPGESDFTSIKSGLLPRLERLTICSSSTSKVMKIENMSWLIHLQSLKYLRLYYMKIRDNDLSVVSRLPSLQWVWVSVAGIVDEHSI